MMPSWSAYVKRPMISRTSRYVSGPPAPNSDAIPSFAHQVLATGRGLALGDVEAGFAESYEAEDGMVIPVYSTNLAGMVAAI
jgi:hypothetical protein